MIMKDQPLMRWSFHEHAKCSWTVIIGCGTLPCLQGRGIRARGRRIRARGSGHTQRRAREKVNLRLGRSGCPFNPHGWCGSRCRRRLLGRGKITGKGGINECKTLTLGSSPLSTEPTPATPKGIVVLACRVWGGGAKGQDRTRRGASVKRTGARARRRIP